LRLMTSSNCVDPDAARGSCCFALTQRIY
jgi:hypothetical protein